MFLLSIQKHVLIGIVYEYTLFSESNVSKIVFDVVSTLNYRKNLVNSKSPGPEIFFRIISSSNYSEIDIKYVIPQNSYYQVLFYQTFVLGA